VEKEKCNPVGIGCCCLWCIQTFISKSRNVCGTETITEIGTKDTIANGNAGITTDAENSNAKDAGGTEDKKEKEMTQDDVYIPPSKVVKARNSDFLWFPIGILFWVIYCIWIGVNPYSFFRDYPMYSIVFFALGYGVQVGYNRLTRKPSDLLEVPPK
jgi:hypothetical protein